mgnify:CR=1 FL=1
MLLSLNQMPMNYRFHRPPEVKSLIIRRMCQMAYTTLKSIHRIGHRITQVPGIDVVIHADQQRQPPRRPRLRLFDIKGSFRRIGGAQAVAALAYGAGPIQPVDKITGPGNAYVAAAKRRVFGQVGIDMIAGPSEILVIADADNNPDWIALDLLSQAEHDECAQSILITPDPAFAEAVAKAVINAEGAAVDIDQVGALGTFDKGRCSPYPVEGAER